MRKTLFFAVCLILVLFPKSLFAGGDYAKEILLSCESIIRQVSTTSRGPTSLTITLDDGRTIWVQLNSDSQVPNEIHYGSRYRIEYVLGKEGEYLKKIQLLE